MTRVLLPLLSLALSALVAGCGGNSSSGNPSTHYTVSATVSGLLPGTSVGLQNNGADNLTVSANGTVGFHTPLASGSPYAVSVLTQPTGQTCTVNAGSGTVSTFNINVAVSCVPNTYHLGGSVSGLRAGNTLVLQETVSGASLTVSADGAFAFSSPVPSGSAYAVQVATQPTAQNCTVANGSGHVAGQDITSLAVSCSTLSYSVQAAVVGLLPNSHLVLQGNGGDALTVTSAGTYSFQSALPSGSTYSVKVQSQPAGQSCAVSGGSGTVAAGNVTVTVTCPWHVLYVLNEGTNDGRTIQGAGVVALIIDPVTGALSAAPNAPYLDSGTVYNLAADSSGQHLFASQMTNGGVPATAGAVHSALIDPATAALTEVSNLPGNNFGPLILNPSGTRLYVENATAPILSVDPATGAVTLSSTGNGLGIAPANPIGVSVGQCLFGPHGTFAYCSEAPNIPAVPPQGNIEQFTIDATSGAAARLSGVPAQAEPYSIAISPDGRFLYAGDYGTLNKQPPHLLAYSIDSSTGNLSPAPGSPYSVSGSPGSLAVSPGSTHLYAIIGGMTGATVVAYSIDPSTGALTPVAGSVPAGAGARALALDPAGKFAYTANNNDNTITAVSIEPSTGALSQIPGSPFHLAGNAPVDLAIAAIHP